MQREGSGFSISRKHSGQVQGWSNAEKKHQLLKSEQAYLRQEYIVKILILSLSKVPLSYWAISTKIGEFISVPSGRAHQNNWQSAYKCVKKHTLGPHLKPLPSQNAYLMFKDRLCSF